MARGCVGSRLGLFSVMSRSWFGVAWWHVGDGPRMCRITSRSFLGDVSVLVWCCLGDVSGLVSVTFQSCLGRVSVLCRSCLGLGLVLVG